MPRHPHIILTEEERGLMPSILQVFMRVQQQAVENYGLGQPGTEDHEVFITIAKRLRERILE